MTLQELLLADDTEVIEYIKQLGSKTTFWESDNNMFWFIEGRDVKKAICLVAHIDTVAPIKSSIGKKLIEKFGIIHAIKECHDGKTVPTVLGADDRAGVYALCQLIDSGAHLLFTNFEECGGIGAKAYVDSKLHEMYDIKFYVELDRKGCNHYVTYNEGIPQGVRNLMNSLNIRNDGRGSYSDIATITRATKVPSVNIATGYFSQHSSEEFLDIAALNLAIEKTRIIVENAPYSFGLCVEPKPIERKNISDEWAKYKQIHTMYIEDEPEICLECGYDEIDCVCNDKYKSNPHDRGVRLPSTLPLFDLKQPKKADSKKKMATN